jgi:hypothetical protein
MYKAERAVWRSGLENGMGGNISASMGGPAIIMDIAVPA